MNLDYTDEQEAFRREIREWYKENLPDGWIEGDRDLPDDEDEREQFLRDWQRQLHESGCAAIHWSEEYGGRDMGLMQQLIYQQEKARVNPPPERSEIGIDLVGSAIEGFGTEAQKERYLPTILSGEELWCIGYSEPGVGSALAGLQCKAIDEGYQFRINSQKI